MGDTESEEARRREVRTSSGEKLGSRSKEENAVLTREVVVLSMRGIGSTVAWVALGAHQNIGRAKDTDAGSQPHASKNCLASHIIFRCPTGYIVG